MTIEELKALCIQADEAIRELFAGLGAHTDDGWLVSGLEPI